MRKRLAQELSTKQDVLNGMQEDTRLQFPRVTWKNLHLLTPLQGVATWGVNIRGKNSLLFEIAALQKETVALPAQG